MHGVLAFSAALILATFLASSPRGVVAPLALGGGGLGPEGLAFGLAFGAGAAFKSSFLVVFFGCGLPPPPEPWFLGVALGLGLGVGAGAPAILSSAGVPRVPEYPSAGFNFSCLSNSARLRFC